MMCVCVEVAVHFPAPFPCSPSHPPQHTHTHTHKYTHILESVESPTSAGKPSNKEWNLSLCFDIVKS